jgi:hypothetical protein
VTRFFDLDEANATLPEVRKILESLRDERAELIRLRDQVVEQQDPDETPTEAPAKAKVPGEGRPVEPARQEGRSADAELRVLRLRMQGVIDQMQAGVARIDELGSTFRRSPAGARSGSAGDSARTTSGGGTSWPRASETATRWPT